MPKFSHIDDEGRVRMVDVTAKKPTVRTAVAGRHDPYESGNIGFDSKS